MAPSLRSTALLLAAVASLTQPGAGSTDSSTGATAQKPLLDDFECRHPPYRMQMVSKSPLVIYLHDFITPQERAHLKQVTKDTFSHSAVTPNDGAAGSGHERAIRSVRTSQSTNVPRDAVTRCIEDRALLFQGHDVARARLEPLQLVKYGAGERFHFHTDWFTPDAARHAGADMGGNRLSSFFAYVHVSNSSRIEDGEDGEDDVVGGGTNFPLVDAPSDERWCGVVDCDEEWDKGVTFRPVEGNAVYWENLHANGVGDQRTLHAGLPVTRGSKIGMNIWTRQGILSEDIRGVDLY